MKYNPDYFDEELGLYVYPVLKERYGDSDGILEAMECAMTDGACEAFCLNCDTEHECLEPDAANQMCEHCGEPQVHSMLVILGAI